MTLRILICIPSYNNSETVCEVVRDALRLTAYSVLVVDDGSSAPIGDLLKASDRAADFLDAFASGRLNLLRLERNRGKGFALQTGMRWAVTQGFTHLLSVDGDGQHLISESAKLTEPAAQNPWDLIIGKRHFEMGGDVPGISRFGRKFSNFWVGYQTGHKVEDSQSGYRLYPLFHLQNWKFWSTRYDFEIEVLVRLLWNGVKAIEVDIDVFYPAREMRVSHFHKFWDNARISFLNTFLVLISHLRFRRARRRGRSPTARTWTGKTRGGKFGNAFLKAVIRILGIRAGYFCLWFVVPYFYVFAPQARRAANEYWAAVHPESHWVGRQKLILQQLFRFGQILMDRAYQALSPHARFHTRPNGIEEILTPALNKRPLILISGHVGSWDLAANFLRNDGLMGNFNMVHYQSEKLTFEKVVGATKSSPHVRPLLSNQEPVLHIKAMLAGGEPVGMMADRPTNTSVELVSFFGKLVPLDTRPLRIAAACGSEVLFTFGFKARAPSTYELYAFPSFSLHDAVGPQKGIQLRLRVQELASTIEQILRKYPEQWFNFFSVFSEVPQPPPGIRGGSERGHVWQEWAHRLVDFDLKIPTDKGLHNLSGGSL